MSATPNTPVNAAPQGAGASLSGLGRVLILLVIGLAAGIAYNTWSIDSGGLSPVGTTEFSTIEIGSYAAGLLVGMILWQVGSVPWAAMPTRFHSFIVSQVQFYQFVVVGAACIAVLIYL